MCEENDASQGSRSQQLQSTRSSPAPWYLKLQFRNKSYYAYNCLYSNESESAFLSEEDVILFQSVCKRLDLPVQPPISVRFFKKVSIIENPTGRTIEYRSSDESANCTCGNINVVSISSKSSTTQFGKIKNLFIYRDINFAIMEMFESAIHYFDGIVYITDCTISSRKLLPLAEVSRPLVIAMEHLPQLCILNL